MTETPVRQVAAEIEVFYDGECPLCTREVRLLERLDRGRGRIAFADIAKPDFDARRFGLTQRDVMDRIHALLPDGRIVEGVEVFRRAYAAVGLGWLLAPTRWPGLRRLSDAAYRWFARNRLRLTGRSDVCETDRCGPLRTSNREGPVRYSGADEPPISR